LEATEDLARDLDVPVIEIPHVAQVSHIDRDFQNEPSRTTEVITPETTVQKKQQSGVKS
jgi:hypothetical protein